MSCNRMNWMKTDVRFLSLLCIVQTMHYLTEFQAIIEAIVPLFVI